MTKNKNSTKYYSNKQEERVSKLLDFNKEIGSGATPFYKGDLIDKESSILIECKTSTTHKESFSIKKEWLSKMKEESFEMRLDNSILCFSFGEDEENYFIIDEKLMKYLVEKLKEENN